MPHDPPPPESHRTSAWRFVWPFSAAGVVALLVVAAGGAAIVGQQATSEAVRDARVVTEALARGVIGPNLEDGLLAGDDAAVARLDQVVHRHVLTAAIVRVKIWAPDGRVLYSDDPRVLGAQFDPDHELTDALVSWTTMSSVSDLDRPENEFERRFGKLLEVYQPLRTPSGAPVVLELYQTYNAVSANRTAIFFAFVPVLIVALALLQAIQVPLAWSMARRLQAGQAARELLFERAVQAQDLERKRIARDVHDGVVQDLIGVSLRLSSEAQAAGPAQPAGRTLEDAARAVRAAVRGLRGFLVEIYPPSLRQAGMEAALADLLEPLRGRGLEVTLSVAATTVIPDTTQALLYRAAQEGVRNATRHANAHRVSVTLEVSGGLARLTVADDGTGRVAPSDATGDTGHFGMRILEDLASEGGGHMSFESAPGSGSTLTVTLPVP